VRGELVPTPCERCLSFEASGPARRLQARSRRRPCWLADPAGLRSGV